MRPGLRFSVSQAREVFEEALGAAFVSVGQSTPHVDDDPDGVALASFQRAFVVQLLGVFGEGLARRAVELELWPSVEAFFLQLDDGDVAGSAMTGGQR